MGNYESLRTSATIQLDTSTLDHRPDENDLVAAAVPICDAHLDRLLENDLREAASLTDVHNSYVLTWLDRRDNNE